MLLSKDLLNKEKVQNITIPNSYNIYVENEFINSTFDILTKFHEQRLENKKLILTETKNIKKFSDDSGSSAKGVISSMMQIVDNFYDRIRGLFMDDIDYVMANSEYVMKFTNSDSFVMEDIYRYSISKDDTKHIYLALKPLADKVQKVYDDCNKNKKPEDMIKVFQKFYDDNVLSSSEEYVRQIRNAILKRGASAKYINQFEYMQEINKKFHCGDSKASNLKIDSKYVSNSYEFIKKAKWNEMYKSIQEDMDTCQELVDKIIFYINAIYNKAAKYNNSPSTSKVNLAVAIESFCNKVYNSMLCIALEEINIYVGTELDCIYQMIYTYTKALKKVVKDRRSKE